MKKAAILLVMFMFFSGCDFLEIETEDPPTPEEELQLLVPYTQYLISYWQGTDNARFPLQWMQQIGGVKSIHSDVDKYFLHNDFLDEVWNLYYTRILYNLFDIIWHANKIEAVAYRGMSHVLIAYSLGIMIDLWGDIPFKNYPKYEEQQNLLMDIMDLLAKATIDLNNAEKDNFEFDTGIDHIYNGDIDSWKRAANVIRLRYLLRMANESGNYTIFNEFLNPDMLFRDNQDNMLYYFKGGSFVNPHYFFNNRMNNTRVGKHIVELLKETEDPRLPVYVSRNVDNEYLGTGAGEVLISASDISDSFSSEKSPIQLITYTEQKFIEAEIYHRTNRQSLADEAFEEAVKSSLEFNNINNSAWEAEHASIENVTLEQIITAKYIALFLNVEVWSDFRRTGYPILQPYTTEESEEAMIPRRFVYPTSEYFYNESNVPRDIGIFDRIWWDVE